MAINTTTITSSSLSPTCLDYRLVGICYWLRCTPFGCKIKTSPKVQHYVPDAVVSSYSDTGANPWTEIAFASTTNPSAQGGGDGTSNHPHQNTITKFKNADVIGHPSAGLFDQFASQFGYSCEGAGSPFQPYLLSTFDTLAWRHNMPEMLYPEALILGQREIGSSSTGDLWGSVYPRGGFLEHVDDHKAAAVVAQRAGDIVTRSSQPHIYLPLQAKARPGYWPAGALWEGNPDSGKWQPLQPSLSSTCVTFPHQGTLPQAEDGAYVWSLWRPYQCCKREGQNFLGSSEVSR
ncbi:TIGR03756 family integrating conjugative element protein [Pseudomonas asplenii]|uniref:TIGR03756 family integrating conjugative element protein n=1 Tax=Pseudomonas asplenii TaxID=53407 RepID=UPI0037C81AAE